MAQDQIVTLKISPAVLKKFPNISNTPTTTGTSTPQRSIPKLKIKNTKAPSSNTKSAANTVPSSPAPGNEPESTAGTPAPSTGTTSSKPGPKGGSGPVNAQLRALDRSGAPTRRWTKEPIQLKSFSGVKFTVNGWASKGGVAAIKEEDKEDQDKQQEGNTTQTDTQSPTKKANGEGETSKATPNAKSKASAANADATQTESAAKGEVAASN